MSHMPSSEFILGPEKTRAYTHAVLEHRANKIRNAHQHWLGQRRAKAKRQHRARIAQASRKQRW